MTQSTAGEVSDFSIIKKPRLEKSHDLLSCTIREQPHSYAHLELVSDTPQEDGNIGLDNLQVKSFCTAALRQFLGLTGAAIPIDILKVQGKKCWVRVPQPDLGAFAAAITAWKGTTENGPHHMLRLLQCSDYLGTIVGSNGQDELWNS